MERKLSGKAKKDVMSENIESDRDSREKLIRKGVRK